MDDQPPRESFTVRSVIKPELFRLTLKRGGWIAAAGAFILVLGGTFLPLAYLKVWGVPLFFAGLILIAIGWLPYRRLQRLEVNPNLLQYDGEFLIFAREGKPLFKIPEKSIAKFEYVEKEALYGAAIWLKKPVEDKVRILQSRFNLEAFIVDSASRFSCDLFLPYFTKMSIQEIKDLLEQDHAS